MVDIKIFCAKNATQILNIDTRIQITFNIEFKLTFNIPLISAIQAGVAYSTDKMR